jgi:hypothetical protein
MSLSTPEESEAAVRYIIGLRPDIYIEGPTVRVTKYGGALALWLAEAAEDLAWDWNPNGITMLDDVFAVMFEHRLSLPDGVDKSLYLIPLLGMMLDVGWCPGRPAPFQPIRGPW